MWSFVLRHALALIFVVSGIAKLADRPGTTQAVANFGLPRRLVAPIAALLPVAELVVAALLVASPTARVGGAAALVLMVAFIAVVAWNLAQGRRPECNCFGRIGGSDISGRTVVRNGVLASAAFLVATASVERPDAWPLGLVLAVAFAALVLGAETAAGRAASRRKQAALDAGFDAAMAEGSSFERIDAPDFALEDRDGAIRAVADFVDGARPSLVCFLTPGCGPCASFKPSVARWAQVYAEELQLVVVTTGSREHNASLLNDLSGVPVLFDDGEVRTAYGVGGTPGAALIGIDGRLAGPPAAGESNIRKLLAAALTGAEVRFGDAVPDGAPADSIDMSSRPAPHPTVTAQTSEDDGSLFLIDEATGATATLNHIGAIVWDCLDGEGRLDEIAGDLADAFGAPEEVVAADVLEFVRQVGRAGLLVGIAPDLPEAEAADHTMADA